MKKILLALVAALAGVNMASAKVNVTSGSLAELAQPGKAMYVVYNYDKETLNGKSVDEYIAEKPNKRSKEKLAIERKEAEDFLAEGFDGNSKGVLITDDKSKANYIMTVDLADFNYGKAGAAALIGFGAGNAKMNGTATIKDTKGNTIAVLELIKVQADAMDSKKNIRSWAYLEFAAELLKAIKKAK